ncbi:uncharacterized protein ACIBXB_018609 isoform 2-T4 [Morphnus guianensis]
MSNLGSFFTWGLPQGLAVPLMRDRCAELCGFLPGSSHYRPDLPLGRGLGACPWDPRLPARCHVFVSSCLFQFGSAGNSHSTSSVPWSRLLGQISCRQHSWLELPSPSQAGGLCWRRGTRAAGCCGHGSCWRRRLLGEG